MNLTQNNVNSNKVAQKLLEFSMILDNVRLEGETDARILISSSKSISAKIIRCMKDLKDEEKLKKLEDEVAQDQLALDEEERKLVEFKGQMEKLLVTEKEAKEKVEKLRKESETLQNDLLVKRREWEDLSKSHEKEEEEAKGLREAMGKLEGERAELDAKVKELKEFMTGSVKREFGLQKDIEGLKLQSAEYEEQNKSKQTENEKLKSEAEILHEKINLLSQKNEKIETQKGELEKQVELEQRKIDSLFQGHQTILGEIIEKEMAIKKVQMEGESLDEKIIEGRAEKLKLDSDFQKAVKENELRSLEIEGFAQAQRDTLKKMDRLAKQKGKLGRILKECKSIVYKSRKLLKQLRRMVPRENGPKLQMSQTMENFYQSQHDEKGHFGKNSDLSEEENPSEPSSKKVIKVSRSQYGENSEELSDKEGWGGEKMYHSTKPGHEARAMDEIEDQRSQKLSSMRMGRFKKHKGSKTRQKIKYFGENYSASGKG